MFLRTQSRLVRAHTAMFLEHSNLFIIFKSHIAIKRCHSMMHVNYTLCGPAPAPHHTPKANIPNVLETQGPNCQFCSTAKNFFMKFSGAPSVTKGLKEYLKAAQYVISYGIFRLKGNLVDHLADGNGCLGTHLPSTITTQDVSSVPWWLVATHLYFPESSGLQLTISMATTPSE